MNAAQIAGKVGQVALMAVEGGKFQIQVKVLEHKSAYGEDRWYVEPVAGWLAAWVSDSRMIWMTKQKEKEEMTDNYRSTNMTTCVECGHEGTAHYAIAPAPPNGNAIHGVHVGCEDCGHGASS